MTPSPSKHALRKYGIGIAVLGLSLAMVLAFWLPSYIEKVVNRQDIGGRFAEATGGTFTSGRVAVHFWPLPHAVVPNGQITIPERLSGQWATARIYPDYAALLTGNMRVGGIVLENPDLTLGQPSGPPPESAAATGSPSVEALTRRLQEMVSLAAGLLNDMTIDIREGSLSLSGLAASPIRLENLFLDLQGEGEEFDLELRCRSNFWKALRLSGSLRPATFEGRLELTAQHFDPALLKPSLPAGAIQWHPRPMYVHATADLASGPHARVTVSAQTPELLLQHTDQAVTVRNLRLEAVLDWIPRRLRVDALQIEAREPTLALDGQALFDAVNSRYEIELAGKQLGIEPLRTAALTLAGRQEVVAGIFDVLRGGRVPWIRFSTQGPTLGAMGRFRNMKIAGVVEQGRLFIPEAELALTHVNGKVDISHGVLTGRGLNAAYGRTKGADGRLWLDLDQEDEVPFFLEIDVEADLAPLPSLLKRWVDEPALGVEMDRIRDVSGTADGVLVLDGRQAGLDVTVDVTRCRFDAVYDRLPAPLEILAGQVQYTQDRIQVIHLQGRAATTEFANLTGHVVFGENPLLQIDAGTARLDLDQIVPWLAGKGALETLPFELRSDKGWLGLDRLTLHGPLLAPARWTVDAQGQVERLAFLSTDLPGPLTVTSGRFVIGPSRLQLPAAEMHMADARLAVKNAEIRFEEGRPAAATARIEGEVGKVAANWIGDRIDLGRAWRLKAPLTVSTIDLAWTADGARTVDGKLSTAGGTKLVLDLTMQDDRLQRQSVTIEDELSQAEVSTIFGAGFLEIDFNGRFAGATWDRVFQEKRRSSGRMEGRFQARIDLQNPGRSSVAGNLQIHDIAQPLPLPPRHHVRTLNLEARDNQVHIDPAVVVVNDQTHRVTGAVTIEDEGFLLDLVHTATHLALSPPEAPPSEEPPAPSATLALWDLPLRGRIISRIDTLTLGQFEWSPFNASVRLEAGSWHIRIEDAALCGIATPGSLRLTPENMALTLTPEVRDAAFDSTMTCLLKRPDLMDGQFELSGRLEAQAPPQRLTRSVNGAMELKGRQGRIYRFNLLSKVLTVVNLTEIFRGKLPDLMKDGLAYESIAIQVDIQNSTCTIKEAVIDGTTANIAGQGTIDLVTGETDMIVLVAPFKTVDALISYTPLIGDWLGGTLISIPVKVTGPFADPTVTPLAPSAVGSSLMNLMKKTIKLPVQIVAPLWDKGEDPAP